MEKWVYLVDTNCLEPSREKEYHEWYKQVHLPDSLETPGFKRARRYEKREPAEGQGKFLTIYEVETEDIAQTMVSHRANIAKKREQGRMTDLAGVVSRALYRQISETIESKQ